MSEQKESLFPTISEIATRTDALRDVEDNDVRLGDERSGALVDQEEGEERGMQEMDSLCMRCHEQVSSFPHSSFRDIEPELISPGCDANIIDNYSLFQGGCGF